MNNIQDEDDMLNELLGIGSYDDIDNEKLTKMMNNLFAKTIPEILKEAEQKEKEEMQQKLQEKIEKVYKDRVISLIKDERENDLNQLAEDVVDRWNKKTIDEKRSELIKDEPAELIMSNSNKAWEMARERVKTGQIYNDDKLYNEILEVFEKQAENVKVFNRKTAEYNISEGILDLNYAFGKSDCTSLRVARYK